MSVTDQDKNKPLHNPGRTLKKKQEQWPNHKNDKYPWLTGVTAAVSLTAALASTHSSHLLGKI